MLYSLFFVIPRNLPSILDSAFNSSWDRQPANMLFPSRNKWNVADACRTAGFRVYAGSVCDQTGFWGAVVANGGVVVDNQSVVVDAYS